MQVRVSQYSILSTFLMSRHQLLAGAARRAERHAAAITRGRCDLERRSTAVFLGKYLAPAGRLHGDVTLTAAMCDSRI